MKSILSTFLVTFFLASVLTACAQEEDTAGMGEPGEGMNNQPEQQQDQGFEGGTSPGGAGDTGQGTGGAGAGGTGQPTGQSTETTRDMPGDTQEQSGDMTGDTEEDVDLPEESPTTGN